MKKYLSLFLACLLLLCALTGCGQNGADPKKENPGTEAPTGGETQKQLIGSNMFGTGAYAFDMYEY